MHKKLAEDLTSLAHSILQMKNKEDVFALKAKAHDVYEKLALLAYVEEYINNTPNPTTNKGILIATIAQAEKNRIEKTAFIEEVETPVTTSEIAPTIKKEEEKDSAIIENLILPETPLNEILLAEKKLTEDIPFLIEEPALEEKIISQSEISEQPFDELETILFGNDSSIEEDNSIIEELKLEPLLEKEALITDEKTPDSILEEINPIEVKTPLIEETSNPIKETLVTQEETPPETEKTDSKNLTLEEELEGTISVDVIANLFEKVAPIKKTLNDRSLSTSIKIDLNDRIAFVKNLFEGNQEDYNRVVSQLNTIKSEKEAKNFILKMVKPDYDWSTKEAYEARLLEIIERRFN